MNAASLEQDQVDTALADAAARFGRERYAPSLRHRLTAQAQRFNPANWRAMADMGWLGIATPEDDGGLGLRIGSVVTLASAAGAWGINEPLVSTGAVAADAICRHASSAQRERWLPRLLRGALRVACVFEATAVHVNGGRAEGVCEVVLDADIADLLLLQSGPSWFAVAADSAGVHRVAHPLVDGRGAASLAFANCVVEPLPVQRSNTHPALLAALAAAADSLGAMETAFSLTLEHVRTRKQFGAALGSHQVVSHRMVDMYLQLVETRALLAQAATSFAHQGDGAAREIHAAKAFVGREARLLTQSAVQLHGGVGITEECGVSHCLRRTLVNEQLHGTTATHLRRFMETEAMQ